MVEESRRRTPGAVDNPTTPVRHFAKRPKAPARKGSPAEIETHKTGSGGHRAKHRLVPARRLDSNLLPACKCRGDAPRQTGSTATASKKNDIDRRCRHRFLG